MAKIVGAWVFVLLMAGMLPVAAEEEASEEGADVAPPKKSIYIPVKPSFVVNYGSTGRLQYIKADISIRLGTSAAADGVRHHMPFIRNNLVMLFASQTDESISSQEGKETLRQEALKEVRELLRREDGIEDGVTDLYFSNFLIQK